MAKAALPPPVGDLRLASYNVRKAVGLDRRRNPGRVLDVVAGLRADIVALQEADLRFFGRPSAFEVDEIEERTGLQVLDLVPETPSIGWHGNAVLAHARVHMSEVEHYHLPGLEPRGAAVVHLTTPHGTLRLVATHLGLLRRSRLQQAALLRDILRRDRDAGIATVILGDLNEWRPVGGLAPLTDDFRIHTPGPSFHAARPVARLDRFLLSAGVDMPAKGVLHSGDARWASDHLPVWGDLRFAPGHA